MNEQTEINQVKLHIKETYVDPIYGRVFEGWMSGEHLNVFGDLAHTHCAMTSGQAIAYRCKVEKVAYAFNVIARDNGQKVEVETVYDFLA